MSRFAPNPVERMIVESFTDPSAPAYGQLATLAKDGVPFVRTVHFHYLSGMEALAFNTHVGSAKWLHLGSNNLLSACYHDQKRGVQFRWESKAGLIRPTDDDFQALLHKMWQEVREEVRLAYWLDHHGLPLSHDPLPPMDVHQRPLNFGTVLLKPYRWDIFQMNHESYRHGKRSIHLYEHGEWQSRQVSLLRD